MQPAHPAAPAEVLDSLEYTRARYRDEVRPELAFPGGTAAEIAAWETLARATLARLLGGLDAPRVPLQARFSDPHPRPGYTRRPVVFQTRPGLAACGHLLVPDGLTAPAPAVLCLPGHGRGADDLVGIAEDGSDRDAPAGYQTDFAIQCVRRGYVTLALEPLGFGRRRDPAARAQGPEASSCTPAAGAALLLGETMLGWRTWDAMRALDLLADRPEVDPSRLGLIGISGGGTVGLATAALDPRVKVTVLSGSFCTMRDSIYSISHCLDNYVPGLLRHFETADLAALIAPRALFCESGLADPIFPEAGVRAALTDAARFFAARGAADRIDSKLFDGGHTFHGVGAFGRLAGWL